MNSRKFLIKRALEEVEQKQDPSFWGIPGAAALGVIPGAALAVSQLSTAKMISNLENVKAMDPVMRGKLRRAMGGEHVPHLRPHYTDPYTLQRARSGAFIGGSGTPDVAVNPILDALEKERGVPYLNAKDAKKPFADPRLRAKLRAGFLYGDLKAPEIFAHELGHATGWKGLHKLQPYSRGAMMLGGPVSTAVAAGMADPNKGYGESVLRGGLTGGATGLLMSSPALAEEARASLRAMKALKAVGASPELIRRARGNLLNAFSSYLAVAALPHASSGMVGGALGRWWKHKPAGNPKET